MSHRRVESARIKTPSARSSVRRAAALLVAAAVLALIALPAGAALYKWTDANGRVIYSDQPPTGNFKVESINAPPPPANPNAVKELASKEAELQQKKMLRADEEAKAAKTKAETDKKREQCAKVRGQIAMMQSEQNVLLFRSNEKGEPVYMDDAARRKERDQLDVWVREYCSG